MCLIFVYDIVLYLRDSYLRSTNDDGIVKRYMTLESLLRQVEGELGRYSTLQCRRYWRNYSPVFTPHVWNMRRESSWAARAVRGSMTRSKIDEAIVVCRNRFVRRCIHSLILKHGAVINLYIKVCKIKYCLLFILFYIALRFSLL